jgi:DNA-directed RNA polymerase I, II, and III subunit RPABC2
MTDYAKEVDNIFGGGGEESELEGGDDSSIDGGSDIGSEIGDIGGGLNLDGGAGSASEGEEDDSDDDKSEDEEASVQEQEVDRFEEQSSSDSEEEEEDDDNDENYLQKMDDHIREKVIENHHPELKTLNYEEVEALATIVRDKDGIIIDPLHKTNPILSRYEKARALGERARQINSGAKPMIEVEPTMIDGYLIALKELEEKRIPFIIQRPLPNGGSEYWRMADLEILH